MSTCSSKGLCMGTRSGSTPDASRSLTTARGATSARTAHNKGEDPSLATALGDARLRRSIEQISRLPNCDAHIKDVQPSRAGRSGSARADNSACTRGARRRKAAIINGGLPRSSGAQSFARPSSGNNCVPRAAARSMAAALEEAATRDAKGGAATSRKARQSGPRAVVARALGLKLSNIRDAVARVRAATSGPNAGRRNSSTSVNSGRELAGRGTEIEACEGALP
mmetsp:Transcript_83690/g.249792  ORF Transcript_83690/g.249792 Transcript_83690/m.249792 type:complete len:225 (-) Transcript_83690:189-863(-)